LIEALARRGGDLWILRLGRRLGPRQRALVIVTVREVAVLRRGGDDGLLVEALPEINHLLLEPGDLLFQDGDFSEKLQRLTRIQNKQRSEWVGSLRNCNELCVGLLERRGASRSRVLT
jgi:hypothetical protein